MFTGIVISCGGAYVEHLSFELIKLLAHLGYLPPLTPDAEGRQEEDDTDRNCDGGCYPAVVNRLVGKHTDLSVGHLKFAASSAHPASCVRFEIDRANCVGLQSGIIAPGTCGAKHKRLRVPQIPSALAHAEPCVFRCGDVSERVHAIKHRFLPHAVAASSGSFERLVSNDAIRAHLHLADP